MQEQRSATTRERRRSGYTVVGSGTPLGCHPGRPALTIVEEPGHIPLEQPHRFRDAVLPLLSA
jgi:hypothetical protein